MIDPIVAKAQADLAVLNEQIDELDARRNDLIAKRRKLQAFVDIYGPTPPHNAPPATLQLSEVPAQPLTQKARITDAVAELLADGQPRHTRVLLAELEKRGLNTGAADKLLALSTLLSRDSRFVAGRKLGWSLSTDNNQ